MIWDFVGRRPLPVRDYVVSIKGGPKLGNHVSKVWRLLVRQNKTDEKLDVKISFFRYNFAKHELAKLLIIYKLGTIPDRKHTVPDRLPMKS